MRYILRYLFSKPFHIFAIFFLLVGQAYCDLTLPSYTADLVNVGVMGVYSGQLKSAYLWLTGFKMLGFSLTGIICSIGVSFFAAQLGSSVGKTLREKVFAKVLSFSGYEADRFSTASLITRSTNDIWQIQMVSVMLLRMILFAPILAIGGIVKVADTKSGLGWIVAIGVAAVLCLVFTLMSLAMPKFRRMQKLVDRVNLVFREILTGLSVIRAYGRERFEEKRFDKASRELMGTQLFTNRAMSFLFPLMTLIMNGMSVLIIWFGGEAIDRGNLEIGDMMAFMTYSMMIVMSFLMLSMVSVMLPRATVAASRVEEVLRTEIRIKYEFSGCAGKHGLIVGRDVNPVQDRLITAKSASTNDGRRPYTITFNNVSFRYPDALEDALQNISFSALPGQTTAIIGATGSGKTTLINLIDRYYEVSDGSIEINGINIKDFSEEDLSDICAYVPQKATLFSGTVESNIKFAGEYIDDKRMIGAARISQSSEFIEHLQQKYDSEVAQGGSNFSGGQKQRLSIARAIAKNTSVIILDDSFSALDYKTDAALRRELARELDGATIIIVAQRINTVLNADQIIVLDEGRIVGIGKHKELLDSCPAYLEIARSQMSLF